MSRIKNKKNGVPRFAEQDKIGDLIEYTWNTSDSY
jgi:hypothetical protein